MRKGDSQLSFDVDLARSQSEENPVYYIQMAHARLSGIFRVGEIDPATVDPAAADLSVLSLDEETALMKALLDFPSLVSGAAEALEPHRVATYLHDTAGKVHLGITRRTCSTNPSRSCGRGSSSRVRHRSFCATGSISSGLRRRSVCESCHPPRSGGSTFMS